MGNCYGKRLKGPQYEVSERRMEVNGNLFIDFQSLPAPVKKRLKALKKIQLETTKLEAKFYEEVHQLECKYHQLYTPLYEKRAQITKGNPTLPTIMLP